MKKQIAIAFVAAGVAMATGAARAANVYWSVGVNLPPVGTVVSNVPVYSEPAPVYVPAPVYAAPPPPVYVVPRVVYRPAPVYVAPPVVYRPAPVVYQGGYYPYHQHHRGEWRQGHRDEYGTYYRDGRWSDGRRYRHDQ